MKPDPNLDEKISNFEKKFMDKPEQTESFGSHPSSSTRVGYELLIATFFFGFIGFMLDKQFGTVPLFTLLLFFVGFATGVYNAWRIANGTDNRVGLKKTGQKTGQKTGEKGNENGPQTGA